MKLLLFSLVLVESIFLATSEEDYFLKSLKIQFGDVPKNVKLFDFLQNENNLQGLLGLHNDLCQQLNHFSQVKGSNRAKRDADTTGTSPETTATTGALLTDDSTLSTSNSTVVLADKDSSTTVPTASPSAQRKRRDVTDSTGSTTNSTGSTNSTEDKDQQQNLNEQQPPADDQGDPQAAPGGENQDAEIAAAGAAYFKQLILNVLRYILNCLMTYINIFY